MNAITLSLVVLVLHFLFLGYVRSQTDTDCARFQESCAQCSSANCRYVWMCAGNFNSSVNASCVSQATFKSLSESNQYDNKLFGWALYDSELNTAQGQRLLTLQTRSSLSYGAVPVTCFDSQRTLCRQPVGGLVGRTCDRSDNSSLPGLLVTCTSSASPSPVTTVSDSQGRFSFLSLRPGTYNCSTTRQGFDSVSSTSLVVEASNATTELCLPPFPGGLTGRVYDSVTNENLPREAVSCVVVEALKNKRYSNSTNTTASASYLFFPIYVFGNAQCTATYTGYFENTMSNVTVRGQTTVIDIPLTPRPGRLFGFAYIRNTTTPITGVRVTCSGPSGTLSQTTKEDGGYDFGNVVSGSYNCTASLEEHDGPFSATPEVKRGMETRQDYFFRPLPAAITGRVFDSTSGQNLTGSFVQCVINQNQFADSTNTAGTSSIYNFTPIFVYGNAVCNASFPGYRSNSNTGATQRGRTTVIDIPLVPLPGRLFGTAFINGTTETLAGVLVQCTAANIPNAAPLSRTTNERGEYDFGSVPNATYTCTASIAEYDGPKSASPLVLRGQDTRQDYFFVPLPAELIGTVFDASTNEPLAAPVSCRINELPYGNTTANGVGFYSFSPVFVYGPATCSASFEGYFPNFGLNSTRRGQVTVINIPLIPIPGGLFGTVFDQNNATLAGANVTCTGPRFLTILTDASGNYDFGNVTSGAYTCTATLIDYLSPPAENPAVVRGRRTRQDFVLRLNVGNFKVIVFESFTQREVILPGSTVKLLQGNQVIGTEVSDDEESIAEFSRVRPGIYTIESTYPDYIPFTRANLYVNESGACTNNSFCPPEYKGAAFIEMSPRNSSINGRVRNSQTGAGVENAQVDLLITRVIGTANIRDTTDARGFFNLNLDGSSVGGFRRVVNWTLTVSASGFEVQSRQVFVPGPNVVVGPVDFFMNASTIGNLRGRVLDNSNDLIPVINAVVFLQAQLPSGVVVTFNVTTNSVGGFFLVGVPVGTRTLSLSHPLYESAIVTANVGAGDPGTEVNTYRMVLKKGNVTVIVHEKGTEQRAGFNTIVIEIKELTLNYEIFADTDRIQLSLPIGTRDLQISSPFFVTTIVTVDIKEGDNGSVRVELPFSKKK